MTNIQNKNYIKLAIIGHGFVGKATDFGFSKNVKKFIIDPKNGTYINSLEDIKPDIVFICVPTPMGDDGSQDSSIIVNVVSELLKFSPSAIKVVKSTITPSTIDDISKIDSKIIYNPEFLREKHANDDFINSEMIILGGNRKIAMEVSRIYKAHSKCKSNEFILMDLKTASLTKYAINTFLATKVIYFNELNHLFEKLGVADSWEEVTKSISKDKRIGKSHMNVPGHDGRKGFGGACFPKDSLALVKFADELSADLSVLKSVIRKNNKIRSEYDELDYREAEQNVSFDDKL
tara:strand:+ start:6832 stop:7704 length:873 start_codon:yes stop_codon:yes gene_type:complete